MKVVLLQDVAGLGSRFEIKEVADGFALNFLIPQKKAKFADTKTVSEIESKKAQEEASRKEVEERLLSRIEGLSGKTISLKAKANEEGHLFAGIDKEKISELLSEEVDKGINPSHIILKSSIKEVGDHEIPLKIGEKEAVIKISVEKE